MKHNSIPKVIHYCWFGNNPLPPLAERCIQSWKKYLPDYEIKQWDESNFDVNIVPYTQEAYEAGKYAFVSDYARFWILYKFGGLYFDTDVEVIKPLYDIIAAGPFMGCENPAQDGATPNELGVAPGLGLGVNPGLGLGVNPGLGLYKDILDTYSILHFKNHDGSINTDTVVKYTTSILRKKGLQNTSEIQKIDGVLIYPNDYFCPKSPIDEKLRLTRNTRTIHHYSGSWLPKHRLFFRSLALKIGGVKLKKMILKIVGHYKA